MENHRELRESQRRRRINDYMTLLENHREDGELTYTQQMQNESMKPSEIEQRIGDSKNNEQRIGDSRQNRDPEPRDPCRQATLRQNREERVNKRGKKKLGEGDQ